MALTPETVSNLPLYISALALLIAVLTALFFYKQFRQIKQEIQKLSGFKNQINALDDKINYVQNSFAKVAAAAPSSQPIHSVPVSPIQTVRDTAPRDEAGVAEGSAPVAGGEGSAPVAGGDEDLPELIPVSNELDAETDDEDTEIITRN